MRTLIVDPVLPETLWATLALAAAVAIGLYLIFRPPAVSRLRRAVIGALLALFAAGLLALLLNPTWEEVRRATQGRPTLAVLLDSSASMNTPDCDGRTRFDAARDVARRMQKDLSERFEVQTWTFDRELRAAAPAGLNDASAAGPATDMAVALRGLLSSGLREESAVVVLSDGIHNVPDTLPALWQAAQTAQAMAVPVYTRAFGADAAVSDLRVRVATPDNVAFVDQETPVRVLVGRSGFPPGTTTQVTLTSGDKTLATQTVTFGEETEARIEFPVKAARPGLYRYSVEAAPLPQEVVRANNRAIFDLRVIDTPMRLLLLEGKPYWDTKFLLRELSDSPAFSVDSAVRLKDGRVLVRHHGAAGKEDEIEMRSSGVLTGAAGELRKYDVVLLGRDVDNLLTPEVADELCRWIGEWGGALVCMRGQPLQTMPPALERAMPVRWRTGTERRFRMRRAGSDDWTAWFPTDADAMPSLSSEVETVVEKPLTGVVARAEAGADATGIPVVCHQRYGAGRVVSLEGSGAWRWALLPTPESTRRDVYRRLWGGLLRWIVASSDFVPGETARLRATQPVYTDLDHVALYLSTRNDPTLAPGTTPMVEIRRAGDAAQQSRTVACVQDNTPGIFRAAVGTLPVGSYSARLQREGPPPVECLFDVVEPMAERLDLRARAALMKRLAEESGGIVLTDRPSEQLQTAYRESWEQRHPEQFRRTAAWDRLYVLLALAVLAAAIWFVRRRGGIL